jgi:RNA polymerase sigma-70 factor (ECF subfamily)
MDAPEERTPNGLLRPFDAADPDQLWKHADAFRPYLKAVVHRVLGNQVHAKAGSSDIVQECLLRAFKNHGQFRGKSEAEWRAWLVAIVRNRAIDEGVPPKPLRSLDSFRELADDSSGPAAKASRREQAARLIGALERLPPDYQEVLRLRNFESLRFAQVAAQMGRSEEAARQLWVRALEKLREEFGEDV